MDRWDKYFLELAKVVAGQSRCLSRQIGAVLVRDRVVVATGYNGPPRGMVHCEDRLGFPDMRDPLVNEMDHENLRRFFRSKLTICPRRHLGYLSGEGLHLCPAAHAEINCITNAARVGVNTKDTTIYLTCERPCQNCMTYLIQAGVMTIFCKDSDYDKMSSFIASQTDIDVITYKED